MNLKPNLKLWARFSWLSTVSSGGLWYQRCWGSTTTMSSLLWFINSPCEIMPAKTFFKISCTLSDTVSLICYLQ